MCLAFAGIGLAQAVAARVPVARAPQGLLFLPPAAMGLWAAAVRVGDRAPRFRLRHRTKRRIFA